MPIKLVFVFQFVPSDDVSNAIDDGALLELFACMVTLKRYTVLGNAEY